VSVFDYVKFIFVTTFRRPIVDKVLTYSIIKID